MTVVQISKTSAVDFHCLNPLNPSIRQQILLTGLYSFIAITSWEKLFKYRYIASLMNASLILLTCMLDSALKL